MPTPSRTSTPGEAPRSLPIPSRLRGQVATYWSPRRYLQKAEATHTKTSNPLARLTWRILCLTPFLGLAVNSDPHNCRLGDTPTRPGGLLRQGGPTQHRRPCAGLRGGRASRPRPWGRPSRTLRGLPLPRGQGPPQCPQGGRGLRSNTLSWEEGPRDGPPGECAVRGTRALAGQALESRVQTTSPCLPGVLGPLGPG